MPLYNNPLFRLKLFLSGTKLKHQHVYFHIWRQFINQLRKYLKRIPEGEITNTVELEELLAECWDEFVGDHGGMEPQKLLGRMEDVLWRPPILGFVIERHGGTVMGSSRAELQHWTVDVEHKTAITGVKGYRRKSPSQNAADVKPIANKLTELIIKGQLTSDVNSGHQTFHAANSLA